MHSALPDATPKELYFRLHKESAEEKSRERSVRTVPVLGGDFQREAIVGAVPRAAFGATQGAVRRKR